MNCRNSSLSVEQALQTGTGVIPVPGAPFPMPIHVNSSCSVTNPLQSFPSRQQVAGPRKRCCTAPQNKEEPSPHQDRVSSGYVPVLSCTVPAEGEEDALCDIQNTPEKWLFQSKSFPKLQAGICRQGAGATEIFCSYRSQKQFDLNAQVWDHFSTTHTQGGIQLPEQMHWIIYH